MSTEKSDPGYVNLRPDAKVFVDGVQQSHCVTADEELGVAVCLKVEENGSLIVSDGVFQTEILRGEVVISIPCDRCKSEGFRLTDFLCDGCHAVRGEA